MAPRPNFCDRYWLRNRWFRCSVFFPPKLVKKITLLRKKCDSERPCLLDVRQVSRISINNLIFIFSKNLRSLRFRSNFAQPSVMGPSFTKQNISDIHYRMWPPEAKLGHVVKIAIPLISLKLCTTIDNGFLIYHAKYFRRASKDVTSRVKTRSGRQYREPLDFTQTSHNDRPKPRTIYQLNRSRGFWVTYHE